MIVTADSVVAQQTSRRRTGNGWNTPYIGKNRNTLKPGEAPPADDIVYPMAFLYSADQQVLTVGTVTSLIRADVYKWGMLMAGALVAAAPPLVIYAFLMDYYIAGLTAGATKG